MTYQDNLKERIKELECLYDISSLISKSKELAPVLPQICNRLTQAFQYPEYTAARITLLSKTYGCNEKFESVSEIKQDIHFQNELIGKINVGYPTQIPEKNTFLIEEKKLLKKVAQEIAFLYEREQRDKNEATLNEIVRRQDRLTVLGEMTAGVAHELNTPLGNVIGFAEFIIESTKEFNTKKDAKKIRQSALHAREIVKKLMLFSCNIPQKLENESIKSMIDEALDLLSPLLKQNQIKINFKNNYPEAIASIDKVQFIQVLFNLLNNAIQASELNDKIIIELNESGGYINIVIQDFGIGVPIEIQDKIFDPFFTHNKQGSGNGLGLSVVHGIIKQHKGRIQFASAANQGTTFVISIPKKA